MAALNFSILLTDTGDSGSGPYTMSVRSNPTTDPAGGTVVYTDANTPNPQANLFALLEKAKAEIGNKITDTNSADTLN